MGAKIYVGGLPYATTDEELSNLFSTHGTVQSARVITDKFTGKSRGFGFVEMGSDEEAQKAIQALHGTQKRARKSPVAVAEAGVASAEVAGSVDVRGDRAKSLE